MYVRVHRLRGGAPKSGVYSDSNGLRIGRCCRRCPAEFAADLENAKIEWREAADAVKAADRARGERRTEPLEALNRTWKVLRGPASAEPARR